MVVHNSLSLLPCPDLRNLGLLNLQLPGVFSRHFVNHRGDRAAGPAPGSPEVEQDWNRRLQYFTVKRVIRDLRNVIHHRFSSYLSKSKHRRLAQSLTEIPPRFALPPFFKGGEKGDLLTFSDEV